MYIKCNPHHAPWNHDLNKNKIKIDESTLYWDASTQVSLLLELEKIIKNVDSVSLFSNCLLFKSLNLLLNKFPWPRDALCHIRLKLT